MSALCWLILTKAWLNPPRQEHPFSVQLQMLEGAQALCCVLITSVDIWPWGWRAFFGAKFRVYLPDLYANKVLHESLSTRKLA